MPFALHELHTNPEPAVMKGNTPSFNLTVLKTMSSVQYKNNTPTNVAVARSYKGSLLMSYAMYGRLRHVYIFLVP